MRLKNIWGKTPVYNQFLRDFQDKKNKRINIRGLHGSAISFFVSSLLLDRKTNSPLLFLADNKENALHFHQDILTFTGLKKDKDIFIYPPFEVLPYEDIAKDTHIIKQRINLLFKLALMDKDRAKGQNQGFAPIIISTYDAILSKLMPSKLFYKKYWKLRCNQSLPVENLLNDLISQGFQSTSIIEYQGQFSQRGGIIDIFPYTEDMPIRIELDGEIIESIRYFDNISQRSVKKMNEIVILPQREEMIPENEKLPDSSSFLQYLPQDIDIFVENYSGFERKVKDFQSEVNKSFVNKKENHTGKLLSPDYYYLNWDQVKELISQKNKLITLESSNQIENKENNNKIPEYKIKTNLINNYYGKLDLFFSDLGKWQQQKKDVLVITGNRGRAMRLSEIFEDRNINNYHLLPLEEAEYRDGYICLSYGKVNYGFEIPSLQFLTITDQEIFGRERDKSYKGKKYPGKSFYNIDELKIGDFIVHIQHGIGQYAGIKSRTREGIRQDYLLIKYAAGDELYVPVDQMNLVHKYIGVGEQNPKLYRLGGSSWKRVKRKVKESVQKVAHDLFQLYKKRKNIQGFSFSADSVWQQELEMSFPFDETPDQAKALLDVKKDMESSQPMERLICGDVGYGKTEIAIRAAFKAVMDSKQVAVLAPTTILAQQHWDIFSQRMKPFPIKIEMLSRFKSKKEQQQIVSDLKEGKIDIVIGTHRLVQKDIIFHNLGLLIVDEEQRFGVVHKERIKRIKEQIDSLTLTATPIPRTLYFSLIGIRQMSLINTPPELRLPIVTYVKEKDEEIIQEAIHREIDRNGQVFYVHNRVQDIDSIAEKLKQIAPEARIVTAHGQMSEVKLENIMIDFLNREYDILVCTTIIEIGLDVPNVNTIIIDDAHQFGLAQLYQLRGRVGRADRRAYAYLLYPSKGVIRDKAQRRLQAIREFSDLGSGFRLAMRDLEIRGAGNLIGKEQHGFVSEIGFNFYCQLLEDSIDELKQVESGNQEEIEYDREAEPEMIVRLDSYIPDEYITDLETRVSYYQKISKAKTSKEINNISEELRDIYGSYPQQVQNLLSIIDLKLRLKGQGIQKINILPGYFSFWYKQGAPIEEKLKKILANPTTSLLIRYSKKGSYYELKLLKKPENISSDNNYILYQALHFLNGILPS